LRINWDIPGSINFGPGIFFARTSLLILTFKEVKMGITEQLQLWLTLYSVKSWDGFQAAMMALRPAVR
jgi:hypothetical protein